MTKGFQVLFSASDSRAGILSPAMGLGDVNGSAPSKGLGLRRSDDVAGLGPAARPVAAFYTSLTGKVKMDRLFRGVKYNFQKKKKKKKFVELGCL